MSAIAILTTLERIVAYFQVSNIAPTQCSILLYSDFPLEMTQPPNITEPPEDIFAELFKPINLTCNAAGNPIYHWERDNVRVATISDTIFQIAEVRPGDRGRYRCLAENSAGTALSPSALVTIQGQ